MRLIRVHGKGGTDIALSSFDVPPTYAILSHTWYGANEEVNFRDVDEQRYDYSAKKGYAKVLFCMEQARKAEIRYCWVDTCCIDRSSSAELSESIASMYRWYAEAEVCFVYLSDVIGLSDFPKSRWFKRGWTLQELLAPQQVEFYSQNGIILGTKESLASIIHKVTGIPREALLKTDLSRFSLEERMKWMQGRETKRTEDMAYAQVGVLGVDMRISYGEGNRALERLYRKVKKQNIQRPTTPPPRPRPRQKSDPETLLLKAIEACRNEDYEAYKACLTSLTLILIASNARVDLEALTTELARGNLDRVRKLRADFSKVNLLLDAKFGEGESGRLVSVSSGSREETGISRQTRDTQEILQTQDQRQRSSICLVETQLPWRRNGNSDRYSSDGAVEHRDTRSRANAQVPFGARRSRADAMDARSQFSERPLIEPIPPLSKPATSRQIQSSQNAPQVQAQRQRSTVYSVGRAAPLRSDDNDQYATERAVAHRSVRSRANSQVPLTICAKGVDEMDARSQFSTRAQRENR